MQSLKDLGLPGGKVRHFYILCEKVFGVIKDQKKLNFLVTELSKLTCFERLYAMELFIRLKISPPPAGLEPRTARSVG